MCFLNELYFTFITHLFFRLDTDSFSFSAKMHLAQVTYRNCERSTAMETCDHIPLQLLSGRKADTAVYWEAAHVVKTLPAQPLCWEPAWQDHPWRREWDQSLWGWQSNLSSPQDLSPAPSLWTEPSPHIQQQGQWEHLCHNMCVMSSRALAPECPLAVPWPSSTLPGAILTQDTAPSPGPAPSSPSWLPLSKPSSSQGRGCKKQQGVLQEEGVWVDVEKRVLKAQGYFTSPK